MYIVIGKYNIHGLVNNGFSETMKFKKQEKVRFTY